jgi:hypothetical protein
MISGGLVLVLDPPATDERLWILLRCGNRPAWLIGVTVLSSTPALASQTLLA